MNEKEKLKKIKDLWQFYTKKDIAKKCFLFLKKEIKKVIKDDNLLFIEPSAWTWSFLDVVKEKWYDIIWFDIDPKRKDIIKKDFLLDNIKELKDIDKSKTIIIWNPPFWKRSKLAIEFFNKSVFYSNVIAFIVPNQFKKYSVQSKLNKEFKLIKEFNLKEKSFFLEHKKDYDVNCVFQIWINENIDKKNQFKNLRILTKPEIVHEDFEMYQYNNTKQALKVFDNEFDFWVFSQWYWDYNLRIIDKKDFNYKKQRLLFKAKNKKILERLKEMDFEKLSKENTTIPWFRKADVVKEYKKIISNKK